MKGPLISSPLGTTQLACGNRAPVANPTTIRVQRERPILFSAPMVRALLAGTKTQTRRIVQNQPGPGFDWCRVTRVGPWHHIEADQPQTVMHTVRCPYGLIGDRLWVKETWAVEKSWDALKPTNIPRPLNGPFWYRATNDTTHCGTALNIARGRWRPSLFMRRWMSQLVLEIIDVRVERLQSISRFDAIDEGLERISSVGPLRAFGWRDYGSGQGFFDPRESYLSLWDSINGAGTAQTNPWVWAITFRKIQPSTP